MKKSKLTRSAQRTPNPLTDTFDITEWTATAKVAEWVNAIIKDKNLPLGLAAPELKSQDNKRPDIIIYRSETDEQVVCLLEFKPPYYEPDDEENLKEPAWKKARNCHAQYFATSNFQTLILFNTERVNNNEALERQITEKYTLSHLEDLNDIENPLIRNSIYKELEHFLLDLSEFISGRKSEPLMQIDQLLIWRLQDKVNRLARYYKRIIDDEYHKNKEFRKELKRWFNEQMWEFNAQENDFAKAARQTAYLLINKIVFYNTLQASRKWKLSPLTIPDDLTKGGVLQEILQSYFNDLTRTTNDYEAVYSTDFIDTLAIPDNEAVVTEIKNLVNILKRWDFAKLGFEIIGGIFEKLIPAEERHNLGQYFTNSNIVDIILRFCLQHETDKILDPACGAGTFLVRAYQHKKLMNARLGHEEIINTLWGVDIAKFPAHLSTINLVINDLSVDRNYPNIVHQDFFELTATPQGLELPEDFVQRWRKVWTHGLSSTAKEVTYPRWFDCIVGNPPYTRQEEISEISSQDHQYKANLIQRTLLDFSGRNKIAEISKRAGIHAYFFIQGTKFLKDSGRFGFIVSNSWLDVDYGKGLQEFFLKNYKIITVIESKVERWFEDADVNTCIIILEKTKDANLRNENFVRFVNLKKRLTDFIPPASDMWEKQKGRLDKIDELIKTILAHNEFYENNELRIYPKKQKELWDEGFDTEERKYIGNKWGKYLRAPEIFFKILRKAKDKFVPLKEIAKVRFGIKTGVNDFFYLTDEEIRKWNIEPRFLQPIIFSLKEIFGYVIDQNKLTSKVIICHKSKEELKGTNLVKYIKHGEAKSIHKSPTCASRNPWYSLGQGWQYAPIIFPAKVGERMPVLLNNNIFEDKKLYGIIPQNKKNILFIAALLNATISRLFIEFTCRQLTGAQAIADIDVAVVENLPIFDIKQLSFSMQEKIIKSFKKLSLTKAESIFIEIGDNPDNIILDKIKPDRRELDKIIMGDILGLTEEEQLEVYRAVVDLVKSRIEKAKSVDSKKKTVEGIDIELLVKNVVKRIGDKTLGMFYKEKILSQPCYEKELPEIDGIVTVEQDLFKWRLSGENAHLECETELEANYLKYFIGTGLTEIRIPQDEKYIKQILPELKRLRQNIDVIIEEDILSILSPKTQKQILHLLWHEIMKMD